MLLLLYNLKTIMIERPDSEFENERSWFDSKNRELVELSVRTLGQTAIHEALLSIAKNFSPEECADIILAAFKKIVEDPKVRDNIIKWVEENHSSL